MTKPSAPNAETERQAVADKDLQAFCDLVVTRAAELMAEQNTPLEMILDRMLTYATAQCLATFGKGDALKMLRQGIRAIDRGDFDHLLKTVN